VRLARAIRSIQADPSLSALGIVQDGAQHYASLTPMHNGVVLVQSPVLLTPLSAPFTIANLDTAQRLVVAKLAHEVEWVLFRAGLPLEDDEAPKLRRRR